MTIPQYALIGSEVTNGDLSMIDGPPLKVLVAKLILKPLDQDTDESFGIFAVFAREDADTLIEKLVVAAADVPYLADQTTEEDI